MTQDLRRYVTWLFPLTATGAMLLVSSIVISAMAIGASGKQEPAKDSTRNNRRPGMLQPLNSVIGSWRGIGQPKRGSRKGAWQEKTVCRWDFSADRPAVRFDTENGLQFNRLTLTTSTDHKQLILHQQIDEKSTRTYRGKIPAEWPTKIQLVTKPALDGSQYRCTIEQLRDIRLVMLFERQTTSTGSFRRVAGIGYTRSGYKLAQGSGNQRECIVTGGQGTISVVHKGQKWYVCCDGCRQAFEDGPDEIIADYLARNE
ncbi:MAG: hypothetical protein MK102_12255 [Fuerstiella sp.]|nr:hypothetical protein [Fuerstiella sp.]